jgi:hypothetical protein
MIRGQRDEPSFPEGWTPYTEADKVQAWRVQQLVNVGVPEDAAEILAREGEDLHKMVEAAKSGLAPDRLVAIFT